MIFWLVAIALLLLALLILIIPLMRGAHSPEDDQRRRQNVQIAREQKRQLDEQLDSGEIDQAAYDGAYADLQTALALELERAEGRADQGRGKWMAMLVFVAIPVASLALYFVFGEYRVIENPVLAQANPHPAEEQAPQMTLDEMHEAIKAKLQQNPNDAEGWFMLGRTLMAKQQYGEAVVAYRRSNELAADEPGIIFALADAIAMSADGNLRGEPETLIARGLELAPMYPNGLWLAGMAAEQRGEYRKAHDYWTRLLPMIADNPSSTREIQNLLAMLEQRDPGLASAATATAGETAAGGASLSLVIDISPELKARAAPGDPVFVYAKAMQGPPMPLAVKRLRVSNLPATLTLSDADAMMPAMKLSSFDRVIVGARVSKSGNPVAQAGDFYTEVDSVDRNNPPAQISLTIDRVR